jgi:hypothetical protein
MSNQQLVSRTDEMTDTVQVITESFGNLRVDHRPDGDDWYRWTIYDDATAKVIGVVALDETQQRTMALQEIKVLLRKRALSLLLQAA